MEKALELTQLGTNFEKQGNVKKALDLYQEAIEIDPDYAAPYIYVGNILLEEGNREDAITLYKLALEKDRQNAGVYNNLGTAYARGQKYTVAIAAYKKALRLSPGFTEALENLASAYGSDNQGAKSIKYYNKAFKISPNGKIAANLYHQMRQAADWDGLAGLKHQLDKITATEIAAGVKPGEDPFINVIYNDNPKRNLALARLWSKSIQDIIKKEPTFKYAKAAGSRKINLGYLSAHFHNHPTGHLIANLFAKHDKSKFNVFVYSCGPDDASSYYQKIKGSDSKFRHLFNTNFSESAHIINKDKIDILIDLDAFTDNNRLQILALRPTPVQMSYLGFPGSSGADYIDYLVTDKIISPPNQKKYYSEQLIYLPGCYQVNDDSQEISRKNYTKRSFGIPESAFVFACFNGTYKIEPQTFDIWMRILKRVPDAVLWLLKTSSLAEKNLKKATLERGVSPERLIFSKRLPRDKHLKRLGLADLALDTFICNGHTTTSDCLWAGVPVITLQGRHFASRVASSILTAVGLPELIVHDTQKYISLAISLAKNPEKLQKLRQKLAANIKIKPFFSTKKFAQNLEKAYLKIWAKES